MTDEVRADDRHDSVVVSVGALRRERLARLRSVLKKADVAAAVFFDPINIRYATDVSNMQVWCLHNPTRYSFVATDGPVVHFEFLSCEHLASGIDTIDEVRPAIAWTYLMSGPESQARAAAWATEITDLVIRHGDGNRRIAVDRLDSIGLLALQKLGVQVVDGQALAEQARMIKTPQELNAIRDAIAACQASVQAMHAAMQPGMTERDLWSVLHQQNIASGGEWIETRLLASGPRTNPWYQECSDRVIEQGDLVALDTDLIGHYGYACDISRTWRADGEMASDEQRRTYAHAYSHLNRLMDLIGPGVTLGDLAARIDEPPKGYHVYSCLVHGVGMCDEYPVAFWRNQKDRYDATILPGMTLCIESYIGPDYAAEGVKLEEQVLITDTGVEVLSSLPFEQDWL
ncbi:MAG: Xaa-Pro peptidase family protein [Acidiferrobacterales bacterium]